MNFWHKISIILLLTISFSCSKKGEYDGVFVINNNTFGISSDKSNARQTTDGINNAIEQAKAEGYNQVKLLPGEYLIRCTGASGYEDWNGIFLPNNITFDLTDVRLYVEPVVSPTNKLIRIDQVENVTILGGHLIGEKLDNHDHKSASHGGSCAIDIACSRNITIKGTKIERFTGSAIWIGYGFVAPNERRLNKNIKILNCDISNSCMQGISIVHAADVEIGNSKIYDIGGIEPGCGIDIEPESDWSGAHPWKSWVDNVTIHHNEFKNTLAEGVCIVNPYSTNIDVSDNYFENSAIIVNRNPAKIRFTRNTLKGWESYMVATEQSIDVYMPMDGANKNNVEFPQRVVNCAQQTGYVKEVNNYTKCSY